jgi:hypothetical protein
VAGLECFLRRDLHRSPSCLGENPDSIRRRSPSARPILY